LVPRLPDARRTIAPAELVARFGEGFPTKDVEPYLRCARCGQREGEIRVAPRMAMFPGYRRPVGGDR
jgi:hypothetical protein